MTERFQIVLADNHAVLRRELKRILESGGEFTVIAEAGNGLELVKLLHQGLRPDALVLDLMMPVMTGIEAAIQIRKMELHLKILILTMHKDPDLLCRAFLAGANGYMLKDGIVAEFLNGLRAVLQGQLYISPAARAELPETCNLKSFGEHDSSLKFVHCKI